MILSSYPYITYAIALPPQPLTPGDAIGCDTATRIQLHRSYTLQWATPSNA